MLRLALAEVVEVVEENAETQTLQVSLTQDEEKLQLAISYWGKSAKCSKGDLVLINTTAVGLGLGTGGFHIVVAKIDGAREVDLSPSSWGHIVKMRYSPMQLAVDTAEEQASPDHALFCDPARSLERTPVVITELHSLLPTLVLTLKEQNPTLRLVYVMPDGASLPIRLSRHVNTLKQARLLDTTVTCGHAWGGDIEAVNLYTGLLAAKHLAKADVILCALGPGVVGTGSYLGFSGMQLAEAIHAVSLLHGIPIFVPRISFSDQRSRHRGVSHHTRTLLRRFTLCPVCLPIPFFGDGRDQVLEAQEKEDQLSTIHHRMPFHAPALPQLASTHALYSEPITTMGRTMREDPSPFQTAYLCAEIAARSRQWINEYAGGWSPDCESRATLEALSSYLTNDGA